MSNYNKDKSLLFLGGKYLSKQLLPLKKIHMSSLSISLVLLFSKPLYQMFEFLYFLITNLRTAKLEGQRQVCGFSTVLLLSY